MAIFVVAPLSALAQSPTLIPATEGEGSLGDKFITGDFQLEDIPLYLQYLTNFIVTMVAVLSVVFIIYGGYQYIISPISEDKEAGKNTIFNAILGLVISILSWAIINAVLYILTA